MEAEKPVDDKGITLASRFAIHTRGNSCCASGSDVLNNSAMRSPIVATDALYALLDEKVMGATMVGAVKSVSI